MKTMPKKPARPAQPNTERPPRLQRVLALAGFGSRRKCEELILEGRVEIDHQTVQELGVRVDTDRSEVRVDGESIRLPKKSYFMLNKPPGVVTTNSDPSGRPRVVDLIPGGESMFAVGRLDKGTSGLILVTNDGELANRLAHPRYGVEKTYRVEVEGHPSPEVLTKIRKGIRLSEGMMRVASIRVKSRNKNRTVLQMVLAEGRNREIRRILASVGHKVRVLQRTGIGPLRLDDLPEGAHRELTVQELKSLRSASRGQGQKRRPGKQSRTAAKQPARGRLSRRPSR